MENNKDNYVEFCSYGPDCSYPKNRHAKLEEVIEDMDYDLQLFMSMVQSYDDIQSNQLKVLQIIKRLYNNITEKSIKYYCEFIGKSFLTIGNTHFIMQAAQVMLIQEESFSVWNELKEYVVEIEQGSIKNIPPSKNNRVIVYIKELLDYNIFLKFLYNIQYDLSMPQEEVYKYCNEYKGQDNPCKFPGEIEKKWVDMVLGCKEVKQSLMDMTQKYYVDRQDWGLYPDDYRPSLKAMIYAQWLEVVPGLFSGKNFQEYYIAETQGSVPIDFSNFLSGN